MKVIEPIRAWEQAPSITLIRPPSADRLRCLAKAGGDLPSGAASGMFLNPAAYASDVMKCPQTKVPVVLVVVGHA